MMLGCPVKDAEVCRMNAMTAAYTSTQRFLDSRLRGNDEMTAGNITLHDLN